MERVSPTMNKNKQGKFRSQNEIIDAMPIAQHIKILQDLIRKAKLEQPVGWKGNVQRMEKQIQQLASTDSASNAIWTSANERLSHLHMKHTNAENYRGYRIEQAADGRFYIRIGTSEIGSSVSMRLARVFIDEFLLSEDNKLNAQP